MLKANMMMRLRQLWLTLMSHITVTRQLSTTTDRTRLGCLMCIRLNSEVTQTTIRLNTQLGRKTT